MLAEKKNRQSSVDEALARGDVLSELCPSRTILRQSTSRWGGLCLVVLRRGTRRFSELRSAIGGVSERMLAKALQDLVAHGLVERASHPVVPPHVDYTLTPLGEEMAERVESLANWIETNIHRFPASALDPD